MNINNLQPGCTISCQAALRIIQQALDVEYLDGIRKLWAKRTLLHEIVRSQQSPSIFETVWAKIAQDAESNELAVTYFALSVNHLLNTSRGTKR